MPIKKPIIGIIPDYKIGGENSYSKNPFYAIRKNYLESVSNNGAVPIIFPYDHNAIDDYLNLIDGILFIGGGFDINPKRYGQKIHPSVTLNEARDNFEFEVFLKTLSQKPEMPILGICNGMQLMNIIFGGDCIQNIPDHPKYINHEQSKNPEFIEAGQPYHEVVIDKKTQLFDITQTTKIKTNSSHHQAVGQLGKNIIASAHTSDGIIEAIEHNSHNFCLGVQWHPEFESSTADAKIFSAFIKSSKQNN